MNSNNDVDMGAALMMMSVEAAQRARRSRGPLGVPVLGHRLPRAPVRQQPVVVPRDAGDRARRPARARAGRASASTTSTSSTSTRASRPPCSSARRASVSTSSASSRCTGGLPFAGGPWNNYVMHAIATMMGALRDRPGRERSRVGQRWLHHQARVRRLLDHAAAAAVPARLPAGPDRRDAASRAGRAGRGGGPHHDRGLHRDALARGPARAGDRHVPPRRRPPRRGATRSTPPSPRRCARASGWVVRSSSTPRARSTSSDRHRHRHRMAQTASPTPIELRSGQRSPR